MTIKEFIEKAISTCDELRLLVILWSGEAVQAMWQAYRTRLKALGYSMGAKKILFPEMPVGWEGHELVCSTIEGKENSQASEVFGVQGSKRKGFLFRTLQEARLQQALRAIGTAWKDSVGQENANHTTYAAYPSLKKEYSLEEGSISARQFYLRAMYAYKLLPRGRPLPTNFHSNIS